jgi:hypothetical protein
MTMATAGRDAATDRPGRRRDRRHGRGRAAILGAFTVVSMVVAACDEGPGVRGSGEVTSETRDVAGFDEIVLEGSGDLDVDVDGTESLVVEAEDNLLPLLTSEVRDGRLELEWTEPLSPTEPIRYTISARALEGVSIIGSADVVASGLDCATFRASVAGAGSFDVDGSCDALDLSVAGSGDFDGEELTVRSASVSIAGSGDALVNASDELRVSIAGSGDVEYLGDPDVELDIAGSGDVRARS